MLSRLLPYALSAAVALLALSEHQRASDIQKALDTCAGSVAEQVVVNDALAASLAIQRRELDGIKERASAEAIAAGKAVGAVLDTLPAKLQEDHKPSPTPQEMNRWFESLFLP